MGLKWRGARIKLRRICPEDNAHRPLQVSCNLHGRGRGWVGCDAPAGGKKYPAEEEWSSMTRSLPRPLSVIAPFSPSSPLVPISSVSSNGVRGKFIIVLKQLYRSAGKWRACERERGGIGKGEGGSERGWRADKRR